VPEPGPRMSPASAPMVLTDPSRPQTRNVHPPLVGAPSPDAEALMRPTTVTGKHQKRAVRAVTNLIAASSIVGKAGTPPGTKCVAFEEALKEAASSLIGVEPRRRVTTARSALQGLIEGGHFRSRVDEEQVEWVWL
jgi:hypothetical protein